jgi:hypothetical protein
VAVGSSAVEDLGSAGVGAGVVVERGQGSELWEFGSGRVYNPGPARLDSRPTTHAGGALVISF